MHDDALHNTSLSLRLFRDHLYLAADDYNVFLSGIASVILIREADDLLIFPVMHADAGGFYIKQINACGDRAIHAADFFRRNGLDEATDIVIHAVPKNDIAGLVACNLFQQGANKVCNSKII